jgi:hypothetical protein
VPDETPQDHIRWLRRVVGAAFVWVAAILVELHTSHDIALPRAHVTIAVWLSLACGLFLLIQSAPPVWRWINS